MAESITEEMGVHKAWYDEAKRMTPEALPAFVTKLTTEFHHDYGTICHAAAAAAVGAAWAIDKGPQGGITGFQAGAIMWEFISHWMSYEGKPLGLLKYSDMLYPQNADRFRSISAETYDYLKTEAKKLLEERSDAHPNVVAHWQRLAAGGVPFGYRISE